MHAQVNMVKGCMQDCVQGFMKKGSSKNTKSWNKLIMKPVQGQEHGKFKGQDRHIIWLDKHAYSYMYTYMGLYGYTYIAIVQLDHSTVQIPTFCSTYIRMYNVLHMRDACMIVICNALCTIK